MTKDIATVKAALDNAQKRGEKIRNALDFIRYGDKSKTIDGQALADAGNGLSAMRSYIKDATDCLETALSSPPAAPTPDNNGWRPISSAPKNGTQIYVDAPQLESGCTIAYFERGHWRSAWDGKPFGFHVKQPTKWQPLPPPPALDKGE